MYQAVLRSKFPLVVTEENDFGDVEGDPDLEQLFDDEAPLALDVIAVERPASGTKFFT